MAIIPHAIHYILVLICFIHGSLYHLILLGFLSLYILSNAF